MGEPDASSRREPADPSDGLRCDFCGATVPRVRRIALDGDYERLRTPHRALYACAECSERKESARRGRG
jgi:DNA-directed RNA polymerase subunit RPC12/RpoP